MQTQEIEIAELNSLENSRHIDHVVNGVFSLRCEWAVPPVVLDALGARVRTSANSHNAG
jgi:hypothetical protein